MNGTQLPPPNLLAALLYNSLIKLAWLDDHHLTARLWQRAWRASCRRFTGPTRTSIHQQDVILNYGHTYPIYSRKFPAFNNPLIELVHQCYQANQAKVTLVDVGANIGDTVILLNSNCPNMVGQFYCIEGEEGFFAYLRQNVGGLPNVKLFRALLAASAGAERALLRTHPGTASPQGAGTAQAQPLDDLLTSPETKPIDMLKIDVDGFDGQVLLGARRLLKRDRPAVIFEWHPALCRQTGNNWTDHFAALSECGYRHFIWYTKFGNWSHFMEGVDQPTLEQLADLCTNSRAYYDWHYDVIALHQSSRLSAVRLAELNYASRRPSRF